MSAGNSCTDFPAIKAVVVELVASLRSTVARLMGSLQGLPKLELVVKPSVHDHHPSYFILLHVQHLNLLQEPYQWPSCP